MSSLTRWVLAHKRTVVIFWVLLTVVGIGAAGPASDALSQKFSVPGKEGYETNVEIAKRVREHGRRHGSVPPRRDAPRGQDRRLPRRARRAARGRGAPRARAARSADRLLRLHG